MKMVIFGFRTVSSAAFAILALNVANAGTLELSICRESPVGSAAKCSHSVRKGSCEFSFSFDGNYQYFTMVIASAPHAGTYRGIIGNLDWGPEDTRPVKIGGGVDGRVGHLKFDSHRRVIAAGYGDLNIGREQYYRYRCRQKTPDRDSSRATENPQPGFVRPKTAIR